MLRVAASAIIFFSTCPSLIAQTGASVLTQHNDTNRTGANLNETLLNTSNVNVAGFGKLFSRSVDGQIYAQPLYVPSLTISGQGVHNVVFVCTEHNSVYAFDADNPSAGAPLWRVNLGPSAPSSEDLQPEVGITGTPVIDTSSNTIYMVAETLENGGYIFRLHALDLSTGIEKFGGPTVIQGSVPGTGTDSVAGVVTFNPAMEWQRPGILLLAGNLYIGFGSHQDTPVFHGWVFSYSATTLLQVAVFCTSPNADSSGVWQGGVGLAADPSGNVLFETGNGLLDANSGGPDYGDSVIQLNPSAGLIPSDYFSPSNQGTLSATDTDLGSGGPILLLPGASLGVGGGKDGRLFLFNLSDLGQYHPAGDQVVQSWQATSGMIIGGNAYYNSNLYVWGAGDALRMFAFTGSTFNPNPISQTTFSIPFGYSDEPALSVSANGATPGTGIVWATYATGGVADGAPYPGILRAFDASNLSNELWNSNQNSARDAAGSWAKFCPPTIANGKVFVGTFDGVLNVYGLLPIHGAPYSIAASGGTPQSAIANSAFSAPLQATVKDYYGAGVGGVTVTFTTPSTDPTALFGAASTASALTNASGVATAPTLTAGAQTGTYTVTASVSGIAVPANFNLSNTTAPANISATAGTPQSTFTGSPFSVLLQATVTDAAGNPVIGVVVTFTSPSSGPSAMFNGSFTAAATTNASGIATAPALTANSQAGSYAVTAGVVGVPTSASYILSNLLSTASLTGVVTTSGAGVNLTSEGPTDWVHWGDTSLNRKSGVTAQISTYSIVGSGSANTYSNDPRPISWSDGTPTTSSTNNLHGLYIDGTGRGFSFTAPADSTARTVLLHVGGWNSGGTLTAHLADGSAADFVDTSTIVGSQYDRNYTLTYRANSVTTLTISWVVSSGSGNVTINAAALSGTTLSASAGTPQSTAINTAFGAPLQATATDASGNPVSGVTVTFTAPASGPSAGFSGSLSATATTNASGIAVAPTLTANALTGSYTITASSAVGSALFNLTNSAGSPATVTASAGTPQSTAVGTPFPAALQATVSDAGGNPVSGVTVTFTAPSSGPSAAFSGSLTATAVTNSSGIATAPSLTANSTTGSYTVTASVTGITAAVYNLTNSASAPASITATTGSPQSTQVTLGFTTALSATVKDGIGNPVSGVTVTFTAPSSGPSAAFGGTTSATATTNSSGVASAPALTANTQAGSYTVTAKIAGVATAANFSLTNTPGPAASVSATAGTPQTAALNTAFSSALQATVKDASGNPVSGVTVTFTAPVGGPSAAFGTSSTTTATTNSSGVAIAPTLTANGVAGAYAVAASVSGLGSSASFSLTNATTVASLTGSVTTSAAGVNLTSEGPTDWVHWGDTSLNRKSGVTAQISTYSIVGSGSANTYSNDPRPISWSDGTPTTSSTNNLHGLYIAGTGKGFSFTAPADSTLRTLTVHVGGWNSGGTLTAHLADGSAADFVDTSTRTSGQYDRNYTLTYRANGVTTLTISWVVSSGSGNVTLNAAAQ